MATYSVFKWILLRIIKKALCVYDKKSSDNGFLRFLWDHCHLDRSLGPLDALQNYLVIVYSLKVWIVTPA